METFSFVIQFYTDKMGLTWLKNILFFPYKKWVGASKMSHKLPSSRQQRNCFYINSTVADLIPAWLQLLLSHLLVQESEDRHSPLLSVNGPGEEKLFRSKSAEVELTAEKERVKKMLSEGWGSFPSFMWLLQWMTHPSKSKANLFWWVGWETWRSLLSEWKLAIDLITDKTNERLAGLSLSEMSYQLSNLSEDTLAF